MNHIEMMKRAEGIAKTSTCPNRQVGASVLLESGQWSSIANDCEYDSTNDHHAEARLVRWNFVLHGNYGQFKGATLYTTCRPCARCTAMLLPLGLKAVYYRDVQPEMGHLQRLRARGVEVDSGWIAGQIARHVPQDLASVQRVWGSRNGGVR